MQYLENIDGCPPPGGAYSLAVCDSRTVYLAGHFGKTADGKLPERFEDEVALALDNFQATLETLGMGLSDVVQVTCVLTDIEKFPVFDQVYRSRFHAPYPARMTYGATLGGGLRFEIIGTAVRQNRNGAGSA